DVDGDAVEGDPAAHPHADGGNLVLAPVMGDPDADPSCAPLALQVEAGEGADDPFLQIMDIAPDVLAAVLEVQHRISHPLAGPVIGVLPTPAGGVDRETARL